MSCERNNYDTCFVAGDTYDFVVVLKDSDNEPLPLEGYDVKMQLRTSLKSVDVVLEKTHTIDAADGAEGLIHIQLTPTETSALNTDKDSIAYVYDVELTDPGATEVQTVIGGTFTVNLGVTR